jgi:RNA polymerase sigma-70 factor (ECF subfamily)
LRDIFAATILRYLEGVGITPSQPVAVTAENNIPSAPATIRPLLFIPSALVEELWLECDAAVYGLTRGEFSEMLLRIGDAQNYGLSSGVAPSSEQRAAFFRSLKLPDLVLARACADGNERAWEHFLALYHQPLTRAAIAITRSETEGRDLADALYAELYGLTTKDGERRCPLDSYKGRGSLIGWLRTTLAQRHVDHHRRIWREQPLDHSADSGDEADGYDPPAPDALLDNPCAELDVLGRAIEQALIRQQPEERFLLAAYYLDERTLLQIARILQVHEATVSRKLRRVIDGLRKEVLRNLQNLGLSKRAAQEALGADPRDLDMNLRKLLQNSQSDAFPEKAGL